MTAELAEHFKEDSSVYRQLATRVSASFRKEFWNEKDGCLYDVIEENGKDASIRPNQIYAVSLPHTMLTAKQALQVVNTVEEKLLAGPGIRSLSPEHKDYHGIYCGSLPKRDAAYHQGTAWGFLMGGFLTAYMKVHHHSPEAKKQAMAYLAPVQTHLLEEGCIGSISEILTVMPRIPAVVAMPRHGALEKFCAATHRIFKKIKNNDFFLDKKISLGYNTKCSA